MESQTKITPHIRYILQRDMAEVLAIENASFEFPWSEQDFIRCLRQPICFGRVAEFQEQVIGFVITELFSKNAHLLNFAVHPEFVGRGVGSALIQKVKNFESLVSISAEVRETNLRAQLFLRENGFVAAYTIKDFYEDTPEDAIHFRWRSEWSDAEA